MAITKLPSQRAILPPVKNELRARAKPAEAPAGEAKANPGWGPKAKAVGGTTKTNAARAGEGAEVKAFRSAEEKLAKASTPAQKAEATQGLALAANDLIIKLTTEWSRQLVNRGQPQLATDNVANLIKFDQEFGKATPQKQLAMGMKELARVTAQLDSLTAYPPSRDPARMSANAEGAAAAVQGKLALDLHALYQAQAN